MSSSSASSTFRIEWRPSRWLAIGLVGLGLLAGLSLLISDLPVLPSGASAALVVGWAVCAARRESRRVPGLLVVDAGAGVTRWESASGSTGVHDLHWHLRGPLAMLQARTGQVRFRLHWWPDTLPPSTRRQLRLVRDFSPRYDKPLPSVAA